MEEEIPSGTINSIISLKIVGNCFFKCFIRLGVANHFGFDVLQSYSFTIVLLKIRKKDKIAALGKQIKMNNFK